MGSPDSMLEKVGMIPRCIFLPLPRRALLSIFAVVNESVFHQLNAFDTSSHHSRADRNQFVPTVLAFSARSCGRLRRAGGPMQRISGGKI